MASFSRLCCGGVRSYGEVYSRRKAIARCPCTPSLTVETFGWNIYASYCSSIEIAGLKKKKKKKNMMMTEIVKIGQDRILARGTGG